MSNLPTRRQTDLLSLSALLFAGSLSLLRADDWPQWLGPQRDAVWRETGLVEKFPPSGPLIRWRVPVGPGFSGPAVAARWIYLTDRWDPTEHPNPTHSTSAVIKTESERLLCLDEIDGRIRWMQSYECPYRVAYSAGPRTTPVVDQDRVYTLGTMGNLCCWRSRDGQPIWARDLKQDFGAAVPMWGFSAHPLVDGNKLICLVGGEGSVVVAFDKLTGKELWRALSAKEPGYCPPVICRVGQTRQLIIWHPEALNSLDPETGKVNWTIPFAVKAGLTVAMPRQLGDQVLVSSFYNGSLLVRLATNQLTAQEVWRGKSDSENETDGLHSLMCTPFVEGACIYGVCSYGQFRCLKAATGERLWESFLPTNGRKERWANAFIVKNGNRFFLWNENGDLIIARLSPQGYEELSRAHLLEPTNREPGRKVVWSPPAFANRRMYARNDRELISVDLAADSDRAANGP